MRKLSLLLAVSLLISCFCACDGEDTISLDSAETSATPDSVMTDADMSYPDESTPSQNNSSATSSNNQSSKEQVSSKNESTDTDADYNEDAFIPERDPEKEEWEQWYMVLANPDNELSKEYIENVDKATINSSYSTNRASSKYLDSRAVDAFVAMCKAAKKDKIKLYAVSAYRTYSYQEGLFKRRIQRFIDENGLGREAAEKKAATMVARPGTSEHHLGLAVDINSVETSFEKTKEFKWLQDNAEKYGFVLRYPKNKKSITKIIYEPWHYRFVGVEHAKEMNRLGLCLEEYIEYLKGQHN